MQSKVERWGGTRLLAAALLSLAAVLSGAAQAGVPFPLSHNGGGGTTTTPGVSLRVRNKSAPPGGVYQMVVDLTEPTPIVIGRGLAKPSGRHVLLGALLPGDPAAAAVALAGPQGIDVHIVSPSGGDFGLNAGAPLFALTLGVPADTAAGSTAPLALDAAASEWFGPLGIYPEEIKNGTFTATGTLCITDVVPGGGFLPAGSTTSVMGMGFQPGATVEIDGVAVSSTTFVSASQLDVVNAVDMQLDSRRITVHNADQTRVSYYAYLRAASLGESTRPLLAAAEPVYPVQPLSFGVFPSVPAAPATFAAVALQNPGPATAQVTLTLQSSSAGAVATATLSLPPRSEIEREMSELFPAVPATPDTVLTVSASSPVQMLGMSGDEVAGTVLPVLPALSL